MNNFEKLKSMSLEDLVEYLDKYKPFGESPWILWFTHKYCSNCEPIMCRYEDGTREFPSGWCELNDSCKFLPKIKGIPSNMEMIKMWLESEVEDGHLEKAE